MDLRRRADGIVMPGEAPALALHKITKQFGRLRALTEADLIVRTGSLHVVLGENGAGKTTLMRIAYGLARPDGGTIQRSGQTVRLRSPSDAAALGIGMVHQHFSLVPAMTVAENVALGQKGAYHPGEASVRVRAVCDATGLALDPGALVADLPIGAQQRVEIVKAFARNASLLILDEPTAVLAPSEATELLARLRAFADSGGAVILVTHRLREALEAADTVTVLRHGATVLSGSTSALSEGVLVDAMVGATVVDPNPPRSAPPGGIAFHAENVSFTNDRGVDVVAAASVDARYGEIVGVAGVEGNGHRELLRLLAGRLVPTRGRVIHPAAVGFVPEDRQRDALALEFSLAENVALAGAGARRGSIDWTTFAHRTESLIRDFDVRAPGPQTPAWSLSGGNQQRFVLGREMTYSPTALVVESPSRGLDVRAAAAIGARLRDARNTGAAVIVYSSDIDELLALADRIVVCFRGGVREVARNAEAVGRALVGVSS